MTTNNEDLKEYIEQLLTNYDSNVDLSPSSPAQEYIITPLVALYGDDPLDTPFEKFIRTRIAENYPQLEAEGGGPLSEILLGPARVIYAPVARALQQLRDRQRADTLTVHNEESLTAKLSNLFLERSDGGRSVGTVRLYYDGPRHVEATTDKMFSTATGYNFFPNGEQSITSANMLYNREGAYYYFDVSVVAQKPGASYNVAAGQISSASGFSGYVRVTNRFSFSSGDDEETLEEFWYRASTFPTEVSLNTHRGITATISSQFPSVADLAIVGYGDEEMLRDMLTGGGYGKPLAVAFDATSTISLIEDGDYDLESPLIYVNTIDFTTYLGPIGDVSGRGALDIVWTDRDNVLQNNTFDITDIVDANTVKLDTEIDINAAATPPIYSVALRNKSISISSIPGGFADATIEPPVEQPDQIHVGGAVDIYIKDPDPINTTVDMTLVSDETYVASYDLIAVKVATQNIDVYDAVATTVHSNATVTVAQVNPGAWGADVIRLTDISSTGTPLMTALKVGTVIHLATGVIYPGGNSGYYRIGAIDVTNYFAGSIDITITEMDGSAFVGLPLVANSAYEIYDYTSSFEKGYVLHLISGEPGVYMVNTYQAGGLLPYQLPVLRMITSHTFAATSINNTGRLYDDVELDLKEPKNIRVQGTDMVGVLGTSRFSSAAGTNFLTAGVVAGDTLRISMGPAEGDYTVQSVGGAGNTIIFIEETVPATAASQTYMVFDALDGPELPVLKVNDVGILDSSLSPVGVDIPCGDPLAFHSGEFTNFGEGVRHESYRAVVGIFSPLGSATYNVNGLTLALQITYPNSTQLTSSHTFVTADPVPIADVISEINTYFGEEYAVAITVGSVQYIGLRPVGGVNIEITAGTAVTALGWDTTRCSGRTNGVFFPNAFTDYFSDTRDFIYFKAGANSPRMEPFTYQEAPPAGNEMRCSTTTNFWPDGFAHVVVGMPSLGRVRAYFKDPTYFYLDSAGTVTFGDDEVDKVYQVYMEEEATLLPAYPTTAKPTLDTPTASTAAVDAEATFRADLIEDQYDSRIPTSYTLPGDVMDITYRTAWFDEYFVLGGVGATAFALPGEWLRMSVGDSQVKTVTFTADMAPQEVADAINAIFPAVAAIVVDAGNYWLTFTSQDEISNVAYSAGVAAELNDFIPITLTNRSANYGEYQIRAVVSETQVTLESALVVEETVATGAFPLPGALIPEVQYSVVRKSAYHITPTEMESNTEAGFYYADFDMVSYGIGDEFNIPAELYGTCEGYKCKGYRLGADNEALAWSPNEELRMFISNAFYELGVEGRPSRATIVASNNIQLDYDYSELVGSVNDLVSADSERVKVAATMAKHMLPHYVGATISYRGGPTETTAKATVEEVVENVFSGQTLEVHDIVAALANKGATYVQLPVQLYVLYQDNDRSMWLEIVENTDTLTSLACFFADLDRLTLTRLS